MIDELYDWNWEGAENEFRRAIDLNPNYATAHHWYAMYLSALGRRDEALAEIKVLLDCGTVMYGLVSAYIQM